MFKGVLIRLSGPICNCQTNNLAWGIGEGYRFGLVIECTKCKVRMEIPDKQFTAAFWLDTPYPEKSEKTKNEKDYSEYLKNRNPKDIPS